MSLFLVKNSIGLKMKKGLKNICKGERSTSIVEVSRRQPTLEEMIELEERMMLVMGRREEEEEQGIIPHRMSCVSSCDILRTARKALNQYPRFSLDGKDAMYRCSFRKNEYEYEYDKDKDKERRRLALPSVVGGESVIWCKPGVVGKLMGLEAMPIPFNSRNYTRERLSAILKPVPVGRRRGGAVGSCSRAAYYAQQPCPNTNFL